MLDPELEIDITNRPVHFDGGGLLRFEPRLRPRNPLFFSKRLQQRKTYVSHFDRKLSNPQVLQSDVNDANVPFVLQSTFEEKDKAEEEINEWLRQDFSGKTSKPNPETRTLHAGMSVRPDKKKNSSTLKPKHYTQACLCDPTKRRTAQP